VAQRVVLLEKGKVVKDIEKTAGTFTELESYFKSISENYAPATQEKE
jgi:ABC-2 type transport system ATP-binding protein